MAQQTIILTCPACLTEFELLEFETQTELAVNEIGTSVNRHLQISVTGQMVHNDCSAIPA